MTPASPMRSTAPITLPVVGHPLVTVVHASNGPCPDAVRAISVESEFEPYVAADEEPDDAHRGRSRTYEQRVGHAGIMPRMVNDRLAEKRPMARICQALRMHPVQ